MNIISVTSRAILDSRGHPTLETTVMLDTGGWGIAAVPSGASTGSHEAFELRDQDLKRYHGLGVDQAIKQVSGPIAKAIKGKDVRQQAEIDQIMIELDGTVNKSKLGANAILSVSLAIARANASLQKTPLYRQLQQTFDFPEVNAKTLPRPMMNLINGGRHANNGLKIQEFMVVPSGPTMAERIERGVNTYLQLGDLLKKQNLLTTVGDEGGYAPTLADDEAALKILAEAVGQAGYSLPKDMGLAIDIAASEFYDQATERYAIDQASGLSAAGMTGWLGEWLDRYPLISVEDPLAEDDWQGWSELTEKFGGQVMVVGDDVFVTNKSRLDRGIEAKAANAILIKVNQIGTLTETMATIQRAQAAGYTVIISHRSGETNDSFISDLAVAVGAPFIKAGAPARGERVAKYNRLLAIEQELLAA